MARMCLTSCRATGLDGETNRAPSVANAGSSGVFCSRRRHSDLRSARVVRYLVSKSTALIDAVRSVRLAELLGDGGGGENWMGIGELISTEAAPLVGVDGTPIGGELQNRI